MAGDRAARRLTFQDAGSAVKAAVRLRGDGPIESWVPARVARWLRDELGLREAARASEAHEISGGLLQVLTAEVLTAVSSALGAHDRPQAVLLVTARGPLPCSHA